MAGSRARVAVGALSLWDSISFYAKWVQSFSAWRQIRSIFGHIRPVTVFHSQGSPCRPDLVRPTKRCKHHSNRIESLLPLRSSFIVLIPLLNCSLGSPAYLWIVVSLAVTKRLENTCYQQLTNFKYFSEAGSRVCLLSKDIKRSIHYVERNLIPKLSCRIWTMKSFQMCTVLEMFWTFNRIGGLLIRDR